MRNCLSPSPNIKSISHFNRNENCDCNCHFPEECKENYLAQSMNENNIFSSPSPCPSPMRSNTKKDLHSEILNNNGLCVCNNICNCPCHCITCICCPCVKDRKQIDTSDYYRNLYFQIKSELELEKKRNERMKYNKKMHENNFENAQKEKEILCTEIEQLKNKLAETMNKLKEEAEKNMARDDELFTFKQEALPEIKENYENIISRN